MVSYNAAPSGEEIVAREIALITDSSACVPEELHRDLDIHLVPIIVHIGSEEFRNGIDLEPAKLYAALERDLPVKSAAPSPLDYLDAIEAVGDQPAVIVTPATEFTRMYRNAVLGAELSARSIAVVDSRSATAGHGLVVLAAAQARDAGGSLDDVVAAAEDAAARVELVAALESLSYLRQSGRVSPLALGMANHLGVRPVFRMRQGIVERLGLPRSQEAALARIVREWKAGGGQDGERSAVFHAGRPERARDLASRLGADPFVTEFSAAMAIHTGPGVVGVAWLPRRDQEPSL
jgi:DegV family protein with EDD domain